MAKLDSNLRKMLELSGIKLTESQIQEYEQIREDEKGKTFYIEVGIEGDEEACRELFDGALADLQAALEEKAADSGCSLTGVSEYEMEDKEEEDEDDDEEMEEEKDIEDYDDESEDVVDRDLGDVDHDGIEESDDEDEDDESLEESDDEDEDEDEE